jgi:antibiotic biosynthesis monooxygenase (ABM) superfamily enzyme
VWGVVKLGSRLGFANFNKMVFVHFFLAVVQMYIVVVVIPRINLVTSVWRVRKKKRKRKKTARLVGLRGLDRVID